MPRKILRRGSNPTDKLCGRNAFSFNAVSIRYTDYPILVPTRILVYAIYY
jgi:hypothetical protein